MIADILFGLFGLATLVAIAFVFSAHKSRVDWRTVFTGVVLQMIFALIVLKTPFGQGLFEGLANFFVKIIDFNKVGAEFIFGGLMNIESFGFIFAFQVLPTIIFFASLMSVLYHLGIMQRIVAAMAWAMTKVLRVSGGESLSIAANVFVGQTEAPLVVRPYISKMTQSELLTLMVGGMATIAGGVLAAYIGLLGGGDPEQQVYYAKHLLSASIMAAPATIVIAKLLVPETEQSQTLGQVNVKVERTAYNFIEAAANGAADGWRLALNVAAMLLAFLALIAMVDWPLNWIGDVTGLAGWLGQPLSLSVILGYLLAPLAWLIGVPGQDVVQIGSLIGQKIVANEFVAYVGLGEISDQLTDKGRLIATYALCGFANFSSIAIQIGGIGGLAPERKSDLAKYGLRAVLGGSLATMMTATIAGVLQSM